MSHAGLPLMGRLFLISDRELAAAVGLGFAAGFVMAVILR